MENQYLDYESFEYYHQLLMDRLGNLEVTGGLTEAKVDEMIQRAIGIIPATGEPGLTIFFNGNTLLQEFDPNNE